MPHSESPEKSPHENDDEILPDAASADPRLDAGEANDTSANDDRRVKLEDMFHDDDEEFPASSAPDTKMETSPAPEVPE